MNVKSNFRPAVDRASWPWGVEKRCSNRERLRAASTCKTRCQPGADCYLVPCCPRASSSIGAKLSTRQRSSSSSRCRRYCVAPAFRNLPALTTSVADRHRWPSRCLLGIIGPMNRLNGAFPAADVTASAPKLVLIHPPFRASDC